MNENISTNLFYECNQEFYLDVFFSWFFRQANSNDISKKRLVTEFINNIIDVDHIDPNEIKKVLTWRQYKIDKYRLDLWIEILVKRKNDALHIISIIFENKIFSNETFKNQLQKYITKANEYYDDVNWGLKDLKRNFKSDKNEWEIDTISRNNIDLFGIYLKLDYDYDEIGKNNDKKHKYLNIFDVNETFKNKTIQNSEIFNDFKEWLLKKILDINNFVNENSSKINSDKLSNSIYQYELIKYLFNIKPKDIIEREKQNQYYLRRLKNEDFIKIGNSRGRPWTEY